MWVEILGVVLEIRSNHTKIARRDIAEIFTLVQTTIPACLALHIELANWSP
jgi:hypothetical protein